MCAFVCVRVCMRTYASEYIYIYIYIHIRIYVYIYIFIYIYIHIHTYIWVYSESIHAGMRGKFCYGEFSQKTGMKRYSILWRNEIFGFLQEFIVLLIIAKAERWITNTVKTLRTENL